MTTADARVAHSLYKLDRLGMVPPLSQGTCVGERLRESILYSARVFKTEAPAMNRRGGGGRLW